MSSLRPRLGVRAADRADRSPPGFDSDLGNEAPIDPSGRKSRHNSQARQPISWRWLSGAVLTGVFGGSLIGAALYLSIERAAVKAEDPVFERVSARVISVDGRGGALPKGDRLVRVTEVLGAKQNYRAPMTLRVGDREVIKDRSLVRIATSVSTAPGKFAAQVPAFNALKLMTEGTNADQFAEPTVETGEADVSLEKFDLAAIGAAIAGGRTLGPDDVAAQVEEERRRSRETDRVQSIPLSAQVLLARTLRAPLQASAALAFAPAPEPLPLANLDVRVVPENVSVVGKYDPETQAQQPVEKPYLAKRGDLLDRVLRSLGASVGEANAAAGAFGAQRGAFTLAEGRVVRVLFGAANGARAQQVLRVAIVNDGKIEAVVAREEDQGRFVAATVEGGGEPLRRVARRSADDEEDDGTGARLYNAFYETAMGQGIPRAVIDELVRLFSNEVDFQRRASSDDHFEVFYGDDDGDIDLMYAAITVGGQKFRYFRYIHEDGSADYYDETGKSARKFLLRKPLASGELRSGFGSRFHPILRYYKMHNGTDWADKHGTPIVAAGSGKILSAGWDSGYGRRVEIEHGNGYLTTYSHMAGFARGVETGARVRQGQVIGFMGSTGLSTGTHLHYEVVVNGAHQDPMRIRVPRGKQFSGREMADFKRHREQVESLMARAPGNAKVADAGQ